jgi:hypothetical protein
MDKGEANRDYNTNKYACSFSKMIQYWRQIWNQRTNGITDIQFPLGFVQVSYNSFIFNDRNKSILFVYS